MVNFRALLSKAKLQWRRFRRAVDEYFDEDYFRSLDLVLILGGIQVNCDKPWKRNGLLLYRLLAIFQFCVALVKLWNDYHNQNDPVALIGSIVIMVALVLCCIKVFLVEHYFSVFQESKKFVNSCNSISNDPEYDASVRTYVARTFRNLIFLIIFIFLCDQVIMLYPSSTRDRIFGLSPQFRGLGPMASSLLQFMYLFGMPVFWGCKFFSPSLVTSALLLGLRSELQIVAHEYGSIESQVQGQILAEQNKATAGPSGINKIGSTALMWEEWKRLLGHIVEQHVELLRHVQVVQSMVSNVFAVTYYFAMILVAILVFLIIRNGFILMSFLFASCAVTYALEVYLWCHMIESFEDILEEITNSVYSLAAGLPYELKRHSEFDQMQTSLMIIHMNASRSGLFSCGGVFPISKGTFWKFCDIIYSLITFLLNVQ